MLGADSYETDEERAALLAAGKVPMGIGENSKIRNCIIDKNARIGRNVVVTNTDAVLEADREQEGFWIRSGIVVFPKNSYIKDNTVI